MDVRGKESAKKKLMRRAWAGHVVKMGDEKLSMRAGVQKMEGKWKRE